MISYLPLVETLKKKGVSIFVLQRDLNNHNLRITLNSGRYLDGKTIDKICKYLDCRVEDVMVYEEGEQKIQPIVRKRFYYINEDLVRQLVKEKGLTDEEVSLEMGKCPSYLYTMLSRKKVTYKSVKNLCDYFDKTVGELCTGHSGGD